MKKTIVIAVLVMSTNVVAMDAHQSNTSDLAYVDVSVEKKGEISRLNNNVKFKRVGTSITMTGNSCIAWRGELVKWERGVKEIEIGDKKREIETLTPIVKEETRTYACTSLALPDDWR